MKLFIIYLLALVIITLALLFTIPAAIADCLRYLVGAVRSVFNKLTGAAFKALFGIAGLTGALTVMASDPGTSSDVGIGLVELLLPFLINAASANPIVATGLAIFAMFQPIIGIVANKTKNPHVGKLAIFGNKVLQLMTFNSSKNQPDVLSVKDMIKTPPSKWESKIKDKINKSIY
ncbi:MAG: hypothetical protein ACPHUL_11345 [Marinomonas gallaica]